jgi:hypothetical protein
MQQFQRVKLLTNKYNSEGIRVGDIGYILEVYGDGYYEVEFSDINGETICIFAFPETELELAE